MICREKSIETKSQIHLVYQFARFVGKQYKHFPLPFIKKELNKILQTENNKKHVENADKEEEEEKEKREEKQSKWQKIFDRLNYLEQHCQKCLGNDSTVSSQGFTFEEALEGQESLLHGKERRQHPTVPWKLAESLHALHLSSSNTGSVLEEYGGVQQMSALANQEARAIALKILEIEIDFHSCNWQDCTSLSLDQTLQVLDQWLASLPATGFDYKRMEEEVNAEEFKKDGIKKLLLQCYPRQLALTLYALVVCMALLLYDSNEDCRTSPKEEEREKLKMQTAGWISHRLLGGGKGSEDAERSREEISKGSHVLLKLAGYVTDFDTLFIHVD